jgi:excisionase family DNA binding protein
MDALNGYLTPAQVAQMFGVSVASVRGWCRAKTIDCVRIGHYWLIPTTAVEHVITPPRPTNNPLTKPYLTITEAAQVLQIKRRTLENWCARGKVPTVRRGRRHEIARQTINDLMTELQEQYQE